MDYGHRSKKNRSSPSLAPPVSASSVLSFLSRGLVLIFNGHHLRLLVVKVLLHEQVLTLVDRHRLQLLLNNRNITKVEIWYTPVFLPNYYYYYYYC